LRLLPIGVSGDLWIGGKGLAKGYFKRPDLTDGAFRTFSIEGADRERYYKTGDVAAARRWHHPGDRPQRPANQASRLPDRA
ncbi:MAG: AMP-binding protein, partial [Henriciella sp.]